MIGTSADVSNYIEKEKRYLLETYTRLPVVFVKGEGLYLWDSDGRRYLDFTAGLGVVGLGHNHPVVERAVKEQVGQLVHASNLFYTPGQIDLAEVLSRETGGGRCFFANSGAEANEAAIKLARKYGGEVLGGDRYEIITAKNSFHGRTLGALAATGQPEKHRYFGPLPEGFRQVTLNDMAELERTVSGHTCAVMLETVQGEGGVYACEQAYLSAVQRLCRARGLLLILDEVQTGMGRSGALFSYQRYGVEPDVITLAKGLGNGFPIGALIARGSAGDVFSAGDHGSTFGGGPIACASALATLETLISPGFLDTCRRLGRYFEGELKRLKGRTKSIAEVRGLGLMLGVELKTPVARDVVVALLEGGIIVNNVGPKILRFLPPLVVGEEEVDTVVSALEEALHSSAGVA